jgi:hypothetical protein
VSLAQLLDVIEVHIDSLELLLAVVWSDHPVMGQVGDDGGLFVQQHLRCLVLINLRELLWLHETQEIRCSLNLTRGQGGGRQGRGRGGGGLPSRWFL